MRDDLRARLALAPGFDPVFYTDDGGHHKFLPAFFETLRALLDGGRDVSLVIRTFGTFSARIFRRRVAAAPPLRRC